MSTAGSRPLLFLFLDGFGLGEPDTTFNPAVGSTPTASTLVGGDFSKDLEPVTRPGLVFRQLDARLGVEGLPQSATGQTTLLTGLNAAKIMGRHYGPWPGPTLLPHLGGGTLFHEGEHLAGSVLANAYPEDYFAALERGRVKANAPVVAAREAGVELRDLNRYARNEAVAPDLSGARFAAAGKGLPAQPPAVAASILARLAVGASFTFLDVWLTDTYGHARDMSGGAQLLVRFDDLVAGLLRDGAGERFTLLVTSDHGNLEDLRVRGHTMNPVPLLVIGDGASEFTSATSILDVAPAVRRFWGTGTA